MCIVRQYLKVSLFLCTTNAIILYKRKKQFGIVVSYSWYRSWSRQLMHNNNSNNSWNSSWNGIYCFCSSSQKQHEWTFHGQSISNTFNQSQLSVSLSSEILRRNKIRHIVSHVLQVCMIPFGHSLSYPTSILHKETPLS